MVEGKRSVSARAVARATPTTEIDVVVGRDLGPVRGHGKAEYAEYVGRARS